MATKTWFTLTNSKEFQTLKDENDLEIQFDTREEAEEKLASLTAKEQKSYSVTEHKSNI